MKTSKTRISKTLFIYELSSNDDKCFYIDLYIYVYNVNT